MLNERWWKPHIERSLYEYDEFNVYLANQDVIERHQQIQQHKQQLQQQAAHSSGGQQSQSTISNSRRMTSFKSLKDRLLGNNNNNNNNNNSNDLIDMTDYGSHHNPYRPMQVYNTSGSGEFYNVVNHYDEFNKPKR